LEQVKRALEEGRVVKQNSCSQPTVDKALKRVRQAIDDPAADFLLVRSQAVESDPLFKVPPHPSPLPPTPQPLPVFLLQRADGLVVGEDRTHVQLRNLASEFGEPVVDLVLAKKREIEKHCPSG
jgi:hypothetical protein